MKKKLIAAILSVAMVATMVPATAFAATAPAAKAKTNVAQTKEANGTSTIAFEAYAATLPTELKATVSADKQTLTLDGRIPFDKDKTAGKENTVTATVELTAVPDGATHWVAYQKDLPATATAIATKTIEVDFVPTDAKLDDTIIVQGYSSDTPGADNKKGAEIQLKVKYTATSDKATADTQLTTNFVVAVTALPNYITADNKAAVEKARAAYEAMVAKPAAKADFEKRTDATTLQKRLTDAEAALNANDVDAAIAAIKNIPAKVGVTETTITDATKAIDKVAAADQAKITNISDYNDAIAAQKVAVVLEASKAKLATAVVDATTKTSVIAEIAAVDAKADFKAATDAQKARAANYNLYTDAKANITAYDSAIAIIEPLNKSMKDTVSAGINTEAQLQAAEALVADANNKVKKINKDILKNAEYTSNLEKLEAAIEAAKIAIPNKQKAQEIITAATAIPAASAITVDDTYKVAQVLYAYDLATPEVRAIVDKDGNIKKATAAATALNPKLTAMTSADYTALLIKQFIDVLPTTIAEKDIFAVNLALEMEAYPALKGKIDVSSADWVKAKAKLEASKAQVAAIEATNEADAQEFTEKVAAINRNSVLFEEDVKAARALYEALSPTQKAFEKGAVSVPKALVTLKAYEKEISDINDAKTDEQIAKEIATAITKLNKDAQKVTLADQDAVYAAYDKYDNASDPAKKLTDGSFNDGTLLNGGSPITGATNAGTYLKYAKEKVDSLAASDVIAKIKAVPTVKADATKAEIDTAREAITAARKAYDGLKPDQKKAVTNLTTLTAAEAALSTAIVNHANAQLEVIAKIDFTKDLTAENIALIKEEKACIAELTEAELAKLNAENYKIFIEKALPALDKAEAGEKSLDTAKVAAANVVYNAKSQKPKVTVTDVDGNVVDPSNYTVAYAENKEVGKAAITVTAVTGGEYTGSVEGSFIITPAKDTVTSLQVSKAVLRVNMKAMPGANHQIWYKLTSGKTYSRINTSANTKRLTSSNGIKAKKKYTVKSKAYTKIDGKVYYGSFSSLKKMTTK